MDRRLKLDEKLRGFLGLGPQDRDYLYFQPPESMKLKFDRECTIIYSRQAKDVRRADDRPYNVQDSYQIVLITRNPDSNSPREFLESFPKASPGRPYVSNNLYHHPFNLLF